LPAADLPLGLHAIEAGYRVLFSTAAHLIATLTKARRRAPGRAQALYDAEAADH
jgi:hypothetical protein